MSRYRGPAVKISRREGVNLSETPKVQRYMERHPYPPGQHGQARRRKPTDYAVRLREKQKLRLFYNVSEKQFRNLFDEAARREGATGAVFLQLLESRLDNVVYRLGFARTRRQARQLVTHGHVMVNDRVSGIPSHTLRPGDMVEVRPKSKNLTAIQDATAVNRRTFNHLEVDRDGLKAKFLDYPSRDDIPENIREQLIVELYSK